MMRGMIYLGLFVVSAWAAARPANLPPIEYFDASKCNVDSQANPACALFAGQFATWDANSKAIAEKALDGMSGAKLEHLLTLARAGGLKKIRFVAKSANTTMAGTMVVDDIAYIELDTDFFNTQLNYPGASERTHALIHEFIHVWVHYYVGNRFFSAPFWQGLKAGLEWNYPDGLNGLVDEKAWDLHFTKRNQLKHAGQSDLAVSEDLNYARSVGFPSLYSMSQLEEYFAELCSFLIHDSTMQQALPAPAVAWLAKTDLAFLLDQPLIAAMPNSFADRKIDINGDFDFVGMLFFNDSPVCTATILKHGFIALARHCLDASWFTNSTGDTKYPFLSVQFRPASGAAPIRIDGSSFSQISGDSGDDDLAYIKYPAELSSNLIRLPIFDLVMDHFQAPPAVFTVGYPMPAKIQRLERFISNPCQYNGKEGDMPEAIYHGLMFGTTCPAWYGSSGSLMFSAGDQPGHLKIWGVLSHTFSADAQGNPLTAAIKTDGWGPYTDSNFSPLYLSVDYPGSAVAMANAGH
jgi:hypothetical protein